MKLIFLFFVWASNYFPFSGGFKEILHRWLIERVRLGDLRAKILLAESIQFTV